LEKVEIGQLSEVFFRSSSSIKYPGKVARLAKQVDTETREFIVDVTLEKLPKHWALGQRAEVAIETASKDNVLVIPEEFVKWHNKKEGVFKLVGKKAVWTEIKQGLRGNGMIEITSGLMAGDIIIHPTDHKQQLSNDCRVFIK
jgi:HlyD family secretion protein